MNMFSFSRHLFSPWHSPSKLGLCSFGLTKRFNVLQTVYTLPAKFVKRLVGSRFYELRISVGTSEYRVILFAMDHENIIQATRVILLNAFLKKSSKDYAKQIEKSDKILKSFMI